MTIQRASGNSFDGKTTVKQPDRPEYTVDGQVGKKPRFLSRQ